MVSLSNYLKSRLSWRPPTDSDPRELGKNTKRAIVFCIALCGSTAGFASTIYFPGLPYITADFNAPEIATTLTAAFYVLFMGATPVLWAALSDALRIRRFILMLSMLVFSVASLGSAFVNNIWGLLVLRIVQAMGASSGFSVGGGVVADCYPIEERGAAFGKFFFGMFIGPLVGPIIGGFLIMSNMGWRATFLFSFAFGIFIIACLFFLSPETYRDNEKWDSLKLPTTTTTTSANNIPTTPAIHPTDPNVNTATFNEQQLSNHEQADDDSLSTLQLEEKKTEEAEYAAAHHPLQNQNKTSTATIAIGAHPHSKDKQPKNNLFAGITLIRHPFILLSALISSFAFGSMFAIETLIPGLYGANYGFIAWQTGLSFLGAGVGNMIGSTCQSFLSDRLLLRSRRLRGGEARVEDRLTLNLWPAAVCVIFGCLLWGWTVERRMTYWAPIIGFGITNFGMNQVMTASSAYIVDAVPGSAAAAASAASNLLRMVFACVLTIAAEPLNKAVGPGFTSVFLACLNFLGLICLIVVKVWGPRMRAYSGYQ